MRNLLFTACLLSTISLAAANKEKSTPQDNKDKPIHLQSSTYSGLKFRAVGPALTSGRIGDIAVVQHKPWIQYIAAASGGVWKTENAGTTFQPIFDTEGSYSIGCLAIDPNNENIIWVGTGENNNQRSVAYGDGLYKSADGGKSWKNVGLKSSEHIGMIAIDPKNSNRVFVAAYGPLWSAGGERGIYLTEDGGENWKKVLDVSLHTGFNEIHFDKGDSKILYATAHQRRRHVHTYISGGPESGIYKSTDGGLNWRKLAGGLPGGDVGRVGLALPTTDQNRIYAIIEATPETEGVYVSYDKGESWKKVNKYSTSGNYYVELVPDPNNADVVYSMDTYCHFTTDGGQTWKRLNEKYKHVDNHAMWINPNNSAHFIMGCDGGLYESFDHAQTWNFKPNLPVTQFYKVAVDNQTPFYNIYGGTQDNFSLGGPSQTTNSAGITNADWFVTNGGDGFESQIDPTDPNIVYAQAQYGYLVRFDKVSGEKVNIRPVEGRDEPAYRFNWDAPLLISPHNPKRLYFAANKVFKSDNRGDSWQVISEDLSRGIDRNKLKVMDRVWSVDAVAKNQSTSIYGNIVALDESPLQEGLLYAGTDDGLIHLTEDGGKTWKKLGGFTGVPDTTYVNMIVASKHDVNTVYAVFNNHKRGDFKPYVLVSNNKGLTWKNISASLPQRGSTYALAEDFESSKLLFVGTEFGVFFSNDGGAEWVQLKSGLPTVAVRDIAIQQNETDLVLATFGRGFYVLDDYSPLRNFSSTDADVEAKIFPNQSGLIYMASKPLGLKENSFQGHSYYAADNAPIGVNIRYYQKEKVKSLKEQRQEAEKTLIKDNKPVYYPAYADLAAEDDELKPVVFMMIKAPNGVELLRIKTPNAKGLQQVVWDGRLPSTDPANPNPKPIDSPYYDAADGPFAIPGTYKAQLYKLEQGKLIAMSEAVNIELKALWLNPLAEKDRQSLLDFQQYLQKIDKSVSSAQAFIRDSEQKVDYMLAALNQQPVNTNQYTEQLASIRQQLKQANRQLNGDGTLSKREFEAKTAISERVGTVVYNLWRSTSAPSAAYRQSVEVAVADYKVVYAQLKLIDEQLRNLDRNFNDLQLPHTPGRLFNYLE